MLKLSVITPGTFQFPTVTDKHPYHLPYFESLHTNDSFPMQRYIKLYQFQNHNKISNHKNTCLNSSFSHKKEGRPHFVNGEKYAFMEANLTFRVNDGKSRPGRDGFGQKMPACAGMTSCYSGSWSLNLLMLLPEARMVPSGASRKRVGMLETPYLIEGESTRPPV